MIISTLYGESLSLTYLACSLVTMPGSTDSSLDMNMAGSPTHFLITFQLSACLLVSPISLSTALIVSTTPRGGQARPLISCRQGISSDFGPAFLDFGLPIALYSSRSSSSVLRCPLELNMLWMSVYRL